jgi:DNA modification methylase
VRAKSAPSQREGAPLETLPSKVASRWFEFVDLEAIRANPNNAREHDTRQIAKLAQSIAKFGFLSPVVIDASCELLCGHARYEAARQLGMKKILAIRVTDLSEPQKRAFMLADNRLAELASWNNAALKRELTFLTKYDINFDFEAIGFETAEIDFIFGDGEGSDEQAAVPVLRETPAVSRTGDLWQLGEHRLCCGNALESSAYEAILADDRAAMAFTDPPYNVRIDGHAGGSGLIRHREFAMASGEMTGGEYENFLGCAFRKMREFTVDGSILFVCMDWRHTSEILRASQGLSLKNICVWIKNNGGTGSFYRSQHEFVFVFKNGTGNHISNIELGRHGRNRTNVWEYRGINSFGRNRENLLKTDPTVKPLALVADAIKDCSKRGGTILDPFAGSGTTVIAAQKTQRRAAAIEIDPHYVDAIIRRWQTYTGKRAVCSRTGVSFAQRETQCT